MKTLKINILLILMFFMTACLSLKTTPEIFREVTHKVETKDFTVVVNYANPFRMRPVYLTSEYELRIKNDSAFAYLPYFGVAHVAPMNPSEGGIKFREPMKDFSIVPTKKSSGWNIRFKVKAGEYQYEVFMNVFNNGSSTISINSFDKDEISFNGEIKR